ncbi:MAG: hypothetical protein Q9198_009195 [Flavoplaca austrocitrina]
MSEETAFDDAVQGVSYVIHVASPTPGPDMVETTVAPIPDDEFATQDIYAAYHTSKVLAYRATQEFLQTTKPHFTIINIMPSFVVGKHELLTTPEDIIGPKTSNVVPLAPIFAEGMPFPCPGTTVHIDDVANVHIAALDPKIEGNQDFILDAGGLEGIRWDDAKEIVKRRFPEAVEKGLLPLQGSSATRDSKVDGSKAERVFGLKYKDFEEQIVSIVGQYLEAVERTKQ